MQKRIYNLEERLVDYACRMIDVVEALPSTRTGTYISAQAIRACHSPAFNYGEAQAAESSKDFIHKMRIILKELKECRVALKIIRHKSLISPVTKLEAIYSETEQLIAIFAKSIHTAKQNLIKSSKIEH